MNCFKCGSSIEIPLGSKVGFRAECEKCRASLHCCAACKYYKPGMKNDCMVPDTEFVSDKEAMNLCEEFSYLGKKTNHTLSKEDAKKKFDDLFK